MIFTRNIWITGKAEGNRAETKIVGIKPKGTAILPRGSKKGYVDEQ